MSDALPVYWTESFTDVYVAALNGDAEFRKVARKTHENFELRCWDTPRGTDVIVRYRIDGGHVTSQWEEEPAPSSALRSRAYDKRTTLARTSAPYTVWKKLDTKEMGVIDAVLSPLYKFEGAKLKVLSNIRIFVRMGDIASDIEKAYE
ncbi:MAG: hypothetical protein AAGH15_19500 [Myxococcota bacterium]